MLDPSTSPALTAVSTVLTPTERIRVDAAGEGSYHALHRDNVDDVVKDLKANRAAAVLVSVARCDQIARAGVEMMVREFPRVPTVALLSQVEPGTPRTMLLLGQSGVRQLIDVREASGWRELRSLLLGTQVDSMQRRALSQLAVDLTGASADCWRFFEALFTAPPQVATVRSLSRYLLVLPSTLMSRFFRAGLPAPKRYLAAARLVRAARLFENPGFSVANIANHLDYSSPQSFGRHVRSILGMTAVQFRREYDGAAMLLHFRESLVLPYADALRGLKPLSTIGQARRGPRST
ncbi:MAG TPA: helix-turn-helix domain-containing protein [Gemmatimonadaceae bacterium]|jgi:AraC-like DNA-binding protein|nr:helix-turn-helix domain-containing protein [Gemmatimonadaceae bacterium]